MLKKQERIGDWDFGCSEIRFGKGVRVRAEGERGGGGGGGPQPIKHLEQCTFLAGSTSSSIHFLKAVETNWNHCYTWLAAAAGNRGQICGVHPQDREPAGLGVQTRRLFL